MHHIAFVFCGEHILRYKPFTRTRKRGTGTVYDIEKAFESGLRHDLATGDYVRFVDGNRLHGCLFELVSYAVARENRSFTAVGLR